MIRVRHGSSLRQGRVHNGPKDAYYSEHFGFLPREKLEKRTVRLYIVGNCLPKGFIWDVPPLKGDIMILFFDINMRNSVVISCILDLVTHLACTGALNKRLCSITHSTALTLNNHMKKQ